MAVEKLKINHKSQK